MRMLRSLVAALEHRLRTGGESAQTGDVHCSNVYKPQGGLASYAVAAILCDWTVRPCGSCVLLSTALSILTTHSSCLADGTGSP